MKLTMKRNGFWLALSLVLMVVSSLVASAVQTAGYTVAVKNMSWETSSAHAADTWSCRSICSGTATPTTSPPT